jgi:peptidoglycan-associated lipoprotein
MKSTKGEEKGMRKVICLMMMGLLIGLTAGCAQRTAVSEGQVSVTDEAPSAEEAPKAEVEEVAKVSLPGEEISAEEIARAEEGGLEGRVVNTSELSYKDILFDFDRYEIKEEAQGILMELANWLINNKNGVVLLEGHCDERGTNQYNLALGDRRANSAKDFLVASGVPLRKINTISYGEERPECTDHNEKCWKLNRRAHYIVSMTGK